MTERTGLKHDCLYVAVYTLVEKRTRHCTTVLSPHYTLDISAQENAYTLSLLRQRR